MKVHVWLISEDFKDITRLCCSEPLWDFLNPHIPKTQDISRVTQTYEHNHNQYIAYTHCQVVVETLLALGLDVIYGPPEGHPDGEDRLVTGKRLYRLEDVPFREEIAGGTSVES